MNKTDILNDAIGDIDGRFVEEYIVGVKQKKNAWRLWTVAAALFVVVAIALTLPFAMKRDEDIEGIKMGTEQVTGMSGLIPSREELKDNMGRELIHVKNAKEPIGHISLQNNALDWYATSFCFMTHNTSSLLAVKGIKVSSDSYSYQLTREDGSDYEVLFYVSGIQITDMLKENNSSSYSEGDVIYIFDYLIGETGEDGEKIYYCYDNTDLPPEEESVYLLSTNEKKSYIPDLAKDSGLVTVDAWDTIGITSPEKFTEIWQSILDNWEYFEENYSK